MRPELLRPDNFTPPTRTPWGGRRLLTRYKPGVEAVAEVIGESWEVSVEPSFPSVRQRDGVGLAQVIADDPVGWLGPAVARASGGRCPLLVKLLDTDDNLSVQVHPAPDDPALAPDESGKPESWIVLAAQPGAGIYLGLRAGVSRAEVEGCLRDGGRLDQLLNFVPAIPGDAFIIRAGTIHAIGAGVTMIEPQHVTPGRRGLTYRFWDWNRRYDAQGHLDPGGQPRPLHVERSLAVTDWGGLRGEDFVDACRARPVPLVGGEALERLRVLRTPWFEAERWRGLGRMRVGTEGALTALTCVAGRAEVVTPLGALTLECGWSAVVPAAAHTMEIDASEAEVYAARPRADYAP